MQAAGLALMSAADTYVPMQQDRSIDQNGSSGSSIRYAEGTFSFPPSLLLPISPRRLDDDGRLSCLLLPPKSVGKGERKKAIIQQASKQAIEKSRQHKTDEDKLLKFDGCIGEEPTGRARVYFH